MVGPHYRKKFLITLVMLILTGTLMGIIGPRHTLDMQFFYTGSEARAWFSSLPQEFVWPFLIQHFLDLIFISAYTYGTWLLIRNALPLMVILLPGLFDLIETLFQLTYVGTGEGEWFLSVVGYVTCLKWLTGILIAVIFLANTIRRLKKT